MKEQLMDTLVELLDEFYSYHYEQAGNFTGTSGNWSGNSEIVKRTANLESFLIFLKRKQNERANK